MSPALLGSRDLVLCAGTLPQVPFQKRVAAAAEGGFSAISLFASDYFQARGEGLSDAELRRTLADFGIAVAELDPLMRWIPDLELGGLRARAEVVGGTITAFREFAVGGGVITAFNNHTAWLEVEHPARVEEACAADPGSSRCGELFLSTVEDWVASR